MLNREIITKLQRINMAITTIIQASDRDRFIPTEITEEHIKNMLEKVTIEFYEINEKITERMEHELNIGSSKGCDACPE